MNLPLIPARSFPFSPSFQTLLAQHRHLRDQEGLEQMVEHMGILREVNEKRQEEDARRFDQSPNLAVYRSQWEQMRFLLADFFFPGVLEIRPQRTHEIPRIVPELQGNSCFCDSVLVGMFVGTLFYRNLLDMPANLADTYQKKLSGRVAGVRPLSGRTQRDAIRISLQRIVDVMFSTEKAPNTEEEFLKILDADLYAAKQELRKTVGEIVHVPNYTSSEQDADEFYTALEKGLGIEELSRLKLGVSYSLTFHVQRKHPFTDTSLQTIHWTNEIEVAQLTPFKDVPLSTIQAMLDQEFPRHKEYKDYDAIPADDTPPLRTFLDNYVKYIKKPGEELKDIKIRGPIRLKSEFCQIGGPVQLFFRIRTWDTADASGAPVKHLRRVSLSEDLVLPGVKPDIVRRYRTRAVLFHTGATAGAGGHYTAMLKIGSKFYSYNDLGRRFDLINMAISGLFSDEGVMSDKRAAYFWMELVP